MDRLLGAGFVVLSAVAFGAMPLFARVLYESGVTPTSLLFLRFGIAAALMWGVLLFKQWRSRQAAFTQAVLTTGNATIFPRGKTLWTLVLMGAIGYAGQSFSYFTALQFAPAGLVAVLLYLYPALVTVLSMVLLAHSVSRLKLAALLLSLVGIVLVIGIHGGGQLIGIFLGILAAVIYSVYILVGARATREVNVFVAATIIVTSGAAVYGVYGALHGLTLPHSLSGWGAAVGLALISTLVAIWAFFEGVQRIGAVDASMLSTLEPVVTVGLAWWLLGERLTLMNFIGGALILTAAVLLARADDDGAEAVHGAPT